MLEYKGRKVANGVHVVSCSDEKGTTCMHARATVKISSHFNLIIGYLSLISA